jgi:hypothetical protein
MSHPNMRHVRLKPYNPAKGYVVKNYSVSGQRWVQDPDPEIAWKPFDINIPANALFIQYLAAQPQTVGGSVPLFDIVDDAGKARIIHEERMAALGSVGVQVGAAPPARLRPPDASEVVPASSTAAPPPLAETLAPMPWNQPHNPAPPSHDLPPDVLADEGHHAESRAAAAEEKAEAKPTPKKRAAPKKRASKRAPASKRR